jgi:hypothetical protein
LEGIAEPLSRQQLYLILAQFPAIGDETEADHVIDELQVLSVIRKMGPYFVVMNTPEAFLIRETPAITLPATFPTETFFSALTMILRQEHANVAFFPPTQK